MPQAMSGGARPAAAQQTVQSLQRCAALPPAGLPFADALGDYHRFPRPSSAAAAPLAGGHGGFEEGFVVGTPVSRRFERAEQLLFHEFLLFFRGFGAESVGVLWEVQALCHLAKFCDNCIPLSELLF